MNNPSPKLSVSIDTCVQIVNVTGINVMKDIFVKRKYVLNSVVKIIMFVKEIV